MLGKLTPHRWFTNVPLVLAVLVLCGHVSCDCPLPERPFPHGTVTALDDFVIEDVAVAEELTILNFTCSEGYSLVGEPLVQCVDDEWTSEIPFCADFRCPKPPYVSNASFVLEQEDASGPLLGSVVRYICDDGYEMYEPNKSTLRCSLDQKTKKTFWEGDMSYCLDFHCPDPPSVTTASFVFEQGDASEPLLHSVVRYSCGPGYELYDPNASALRCSMDLVTRNAFWEGELPSCFEKKDCIDPGESPNGERRGDCCSPGSTLRYSCRNDTHELVGDPEITCLRTGNWSSRRPLCRPLFTEYCEFPDSRPHAKLRGTKEGDYFVPGEEVEVWCEPGYKCEGNDNVECGVGGMWTKEFCECKEVFCERPPSIENGNIPEMKDTNMTLFPFGFDIHYVCDEGYRVEGGDSWRMCIKRGVWSGRNPRCEAIRCLDPGTPDHSMRSSSDLSVGSRITFRCESDYEMLGSGELLCQANGQWAGELTRCDHTDNFCPDPGAPIGGSKNKSKYNKGSKVRFQCDRGTVMQGSRVRQCLPDRTWSGTPTKCIGVYDFDNAAQVKNELLMKLEEYKDQYSSMGRQIIDTSFKGRTIIYFAFDVSGSIPKDNFAKSIDFAKAIVKLVGVSPAGTRVGAVTFASITRGIFLPMHYETEEEVLDALDKIEHTGGGTSASSALKFIRTEYMPIVRAQLPGEEIKSVVLILTDGRANMGGDPKQEADELKAAGVEIYCVGITGNLAKKVLYDIASKDPKTKKSYVFMLQDYGTMAWLVQEIAHGEANYSQCGLGKENVGVASSRIVGGQAVTEPWPWMAALNMTRTKGKPLKMLQCGGSIIHPRFILTAAHCIYFNTSDIKRERDDIVVKIGMVHVTDTEHVQELQVRKIYIHDRYNHKSLDYDVALLELKSPIQYSSRHLPICLPPKDIPVNSPFYKPGSKVWIAGWGHVKMVKKVFQWNTITTSDFLKEIQLEIQPQDTCNKSLIDEKIRVEKFTDRMFCAGTGGVMNDTCKGDSGGPVMQQYFNEAGYATWTQVGIVSKGLGCGQKGEYGIYANLHEVMPWVDNTIREAEKWLAPWGNS